MDSLYIVNEFVNTAYKPFGICTVDCWKSIFESNNESMNVFTSILNIALTIGWTWYIYSFVQTKPRTTKNTIFAVLLLIAGVSHVITWTASLLAHAFSTHESVKLVDQLWRYDMATIYLSVMGFCNLVLFIELYQYISVSLLVILLIVGSLTCIGAMGFLLTKPDIHDERHRVLRAVPWIVTVGIYFLPILWKLITIGQGDWTFWFILSILWYGVGGFFFVTKFPECSAAWKGLETWCLSHHWWHWANIVADSFVFLGIATFAMSTT